MSSLADQRERLSGRRETAWGEESREVDGQARASTRKKEEYRTLHPFLPGRTKGKERLS
jgi:hypothetical protein